jgi:tetratricopeptide (TPR) repeat protein
MPWLKGAGLIVLTAAVSSVAVKAAQPDSSESIQSYLAAAQQSAARKDFSAAADSYRKAVELSPESAELWTNLGLMYHETSQSSKAIKSFSEASRLKPSLYVPQLFLGIENLELKQPEAAIPFLQKAERINPKDPQASLTLGRAYSMAGNGIGASDAYWRAVTLTPRSGNAWLGLGMAYLLQVDSDARTMTRAYSNSKYDKLRASELFAEQGKLVQAARAYKAELLEVSPPPCSHAGYGMVLLRQNALAEAKQQFDQEANAHSGCPLTRLGLAGLQLAMGDTDKGLNLLIDLWNSDEGFLRENLLMLREAVGAEQSTKLLELLKQRQGENKLAAGLAFLVQEAMESDALPPVIQIESEAGEPVGTISSQAMLDAEKLFASGQYRKCSDSLRPYMSALTERYVVVLTSCAYYTGDYRTAALAARRLTANVSMRPVGLYWESKADQKQAIASLTRAGELDGNSPRMHVLLGDIYRQKRKWGEAESEYRKALALEPGSRMGKLGLAIALFQDGNSDGAFAADGELLQKDADDPQANLLAAEIMVFRHEYADAEQYLNKCRKIDSEFLPRVHTLFGEVYANTDRAPEALAEFKSGAADDPDGSIHFQMARLYQKQGNAKAAAEAIQTSKRFRAQWDASAADSVQQSYTDISRK